MNWVSKALKSSKYSMVLLSIIYLLISGYFFSKYGVKIVNDSPRYLDYASNLQSGFYYHPLNFWYFTYVIFIYIHQFFSTSLLPIIISQYLVGGVAVLALYRATEMLANSKLAAFFAGLLFIIYPDNIFWHSYILTESIYSSFLCFSLYTIIIHRRSQKRGTLVFVILVTLLCFFSKPTSPALILALLSPLIIKFFMDPAYRIWKTLGSVAAVISVILLANQMIIKHEVLLIYTMGDIVFAVHQFPSYIYHDFLTVTPPGNMHLPGQGGLLLLDMLEFVVYNPAYWAKLFFSKMAMYLTHLRPYWSIAHNSAVILFIWPSYFYGIMALKNGLVSKPLVTGSLIYFSIHVLIISITWVDWDARFFVPLFPLLALLGAIGLGHKIESLPHFRSEKSASKEIETENPTVNKKNSL